MRRKRKRKIRTKMVREVLENHKGPKIINRKLERGRKLLSSLKTKDGTEVNDKEQITQVTEDFCRELYSTDQPDWRVNEDWNEKSNDVPTSTNTKGRGEECFISDEKGKGSSGGSNDCRYY